MQHKLSEPEQPEAGGDPADAQASRDHAMAFRAAADELRRGGTADPGNAADPHGVRRWAEQTGRLIRDPGFERLPLLSNSTSEHEVWHDPEAGLVWKRTWPGFYGQVPDAGNGFLSRRPATPAEYLERQALQDEAFQSTLKLCGVHASGKPSMIIGEPDGQPSFLVTQQHVRGVPGKVAGLDDVEKFMTEHGFRPAAGSYFGWYRPGDRVAVVDAKPDNFVRTEKGLVPIDLQMAQLTPEQEAKAGLQGAKE